MITGGPETPGAKLQVIDEENTVIDEWVSAYQVVHKNCRLNCRKKIYSP